MNPKTTRRAFCAALPAMAAPAALSASSPDPVVAPYRDWCAAREDWAALCYLPRNESWDDPRSRDAERREDEALEAILTATPNSDAGFAALAHVLWLELGQGFVKRDSEWTPEQPDSYNARAVLAMWRDATGSTGYPPGPLA